mmetsp:Transcript_20903/g.62318  ORF Transcript_20903/g.62318 Transcript_20903/m.62318 type:complete len:329 (+) Transcript_20903:692-1678(+)
MRLRHVLLLEVDNGHREGRGVHEDLPARGQELQEVLNDGLELGAQELVSLVHDNHVARLQLANVLVGQIENAAGGRDDDMDLVVQTHDVFPQTGPSSRDHALDVHVLAQLLHHRGGLESQLTRGHEDQALNYVLGGGALLEQGDHEGARLAGAVLRAREHRLSRQGYRNAILLDRRGLLVPLLKNSHQELPLQEVVLEVVALGGSDVLRLHALVRGRADDLGLPVVISPYLLGRGVRGLLAPRDGRRVRPDLRVGAERRGATAGARTRTAALAAAAALPAPVPLAALVVTHYCLERCAAAGGAASLKLRPSTRVAGQDRQTLEPMLAT